MIPWVGKEAQEIIGSFVVTNFCFAPKPLSWDDRMVVTTLSSLFTGVPFPKNFLQICKKILCRLFRVFVHVYIHHFDRIILMGAEAHINTCYKHFYYFVTELNLIDRKELEPLVSLRSGRKL